MEELEKVYRIVRNCMGSLVGGSGHLAGYTLNKDSFKITKQEILKNELIFYFEVFGFYISEFIHEDESQEPPPEGLVGKIHLDKNYNLVRDENGRIKLFPWNCLIIESPVQKKEERKEILNEKKEKGTLSTKEIDDLLRGL
ncbi:MAG: hypothetical protein KDK36_01665 [Leptospiraceae bacterium]|nr:hypothetical protein [Leptospiraceae bacterium]